MVPPIKKTLFVAELPVISILKFQMFPPNDLFNPVFEQLIKFVPDKFNDDVAKEWKEELGSLMMFSSTFKYCVQYYSILSNNVENDPLCVNYYSE